MVTVDTAVADSPTTGQLTRYRQRIDRRLRRFLKEQNMTGLLDSVVEAHCGLHPLGTGGVYSLGHGDRRRVLDGERLAGRA